MDRVDRFKIVKDIDSNNDGTDDKMNTDNDQDIDNVLGNEEDGDNRQECNIM